MRAFRNKSPPKVRSPNVVWSEKQKPMSLQDLSSSDLLSQAFVLSSNSKELCHYQQQQAHDFEKAFENPPYASVNMNDLIHQQQKANPRSPRPDESLNLDNCSEGGEEEQEDAICFDDNSDLENTAPHSTTVRFASKVNKKNSTRKQKEQQREAKVSQRRGSQEVGTHITKPEKKVTRKAVDSTKNIPHVNKQQQEAKVQNRLSSVLQQRDDLHEELQKCKKQMLRYKQSAGEAEDVAKLLTETLTELERSTLQLQTTQHALDNSRLLNEQQQVIIVELQSTIRETRDELFCLKTTQSNSFRERHLNAQDREEMSRMLLEIQQQDKSLNQCAAALKQEEATFVKKMKEAQAAVLKTGTGAELSPFRLAADFTVLELKENGVIHDLEQQCKELSLQLSQRQIYSSPAHALTSSKASSFPSLSRSSSNTSNNNNNSETAVADGGGSIVKGSQEAINSSLLKCKSLLESEIAKLECSLETQLKSNDNLSAQLSRVQEDLEMKMKEHEIKLQQASEQLKKKEQEFDEKIESLYQEFSDKEAAMQADHLLVVNSLMREHKAAKGQALNEVNEILRIQMEEEKKKTTLECTALVIACEEKEISLLKKANEEQDAIRLSSSKQLESLKEAHKKMLAEVQAEHAKKLEHSSIELEEHKKLLKAIKNEMELQATQLDLVQMAFRNTDAELHEKKSATQAATERMLLLETQKKNLEEQKKKVEQEMGDKMQEIEAQNHQLEVDAAHKERTISMLQNRMDDNETAAMLKYESRELETAREHEKLQGELAALETKLAEIERTRIANIVKEKVKLKRKFEEKEKVLADELAGVQALLKSAQAEVLAITQEHIDCLDENNQNKKALLEEQHTTNLLQEEVTAKKEELSVMTKQWEEVCEQLNLARLGKLDMHAKLEAYTDEQTQLMSELTAKFEDSEAVIVQLQEAVTKLEKAKSDLQAEMKQQEAEMVEEINLLSTAKLAKENELVVCTKSMSAQKQASRETEQKLRKAEAALTTSEETQASMQGVLTSLSKEMDCLREEVSSKEQRLRTMKAEMKAREEKEREGSSVMQMKNNEFEALSRECQQWKETCTTMSDELAGLRKLQLENEKALNAQIKQVNVKGNELREMAVVLAACKQAEQERAEQCQQLQEDLASLFEKWTLATQHIALVEETIAQLSVEAASLAVKHKNEQQALEEQCLEKELLTREQAEERCSAMNKEMAALVEQLQAAQIVGETDDQPGSPSLVAAAGALTMNKSSQQHEGKEGGKGGEESIEALQQKLDLALKTVIEKTNGCDHMHGRLQMMSVSLEEKKKENKLLRKAKKHVDKTIADLRKQIGETSLVFFATKHDDDDDKQGEQTKECESGGGSTLPAIDERSEVNTERRGSQSSPSRSRITPCPAERTSEAILHRLQQVFLRSCERNEMLCFKVDKMTGTVTHLQTELDAANLAKLALEEECKQTIKTLEELVSAKKTQEAASESPTRSNKLNDVDTENLQQDRDAKVMALKRLEKQCEGLRCDLDITSKSIVLLEKENGLLRSRSVAFKELKECSTKNHTAAKCTSGDLQKRITFYETQLKEADSMLQTFKDSWQESSSILTGEVEELKTRLLATQLELEFAVSGKSTDHQSYVQLHAEAMAHEKKVGELVRQVKAAESQVIAKQVQWVNAMDHMNELEFQNLKFKQRFQDLSSSATAQATRSSASKGGMFSNGDEVSSKPVVEEENQGNNRERKQQQQQQQQPITPIKASDYYVVQSPESK